MKILDSFETEKKVEGSTIDHSTYEHQRMEKNVQIPEKTKRSYNSNKNTK